MNAIRRTAMAVLWLLAGVGIACAGVWAATAAGIIKPLIVISGSMEPEIMTGDLLIATKVPTSELAIGDVVSLPSDLTGDLVTHRIIRIEPADDGGYTVSMKGDANEFEDALDYHVSGEVWMPRAQVSGAGTVVTRMTTPAVAIPLLAGLVGLIGLSWLLPAPAKRGARRMTSSLGADAHATDVCDSTPEPQTRAVAANPIAATAHMTRRARRARLVAPARELER